MRTILALATALVVATGGLDAQQRPGQRQQLQARVMERYMENVRSNAGLTDEQYQRFREINRQSFAARQEIRERERALWQALEGQMRPGIAADADSVTRLLDGLVEVGEAMLEQTRQEQAAYAEFLSPVQRAQLTVMGRRLQQNIEGIIRRRGPGRGGG